MPSQFPILIKRRNQALKLSETPCAVLVEDNWDDFTYNTLFLLTYHDGSGPPQDIGYVKIANESMTSGATPIPAQFVALADGYFSLGQSDTYYATLHKLPPNVRSHILKALRDMVADDDLFQEYGQLDVTIKSLLRSVSLKSVTGQFRRVLRGAAALTRFSFSFHPPSQDDRQPHAMTFEVRPDSLPPTNIHVLIGRNGVGKSHTLQAMAKAIRSGNARTGSSGYFSETSPSTLESTFSVPFSSAITVTFSAFDEFPSLAYESEYTNYIKYFYIGLSTSDTGSSSLPKTPQQLADEFGRSLAACCREPHLSRLQRVLQSLEVDAYFREEGIGDIASSAASSTNAIFACTRLFGKLSSGHKIVLLTIVRLVELVEEKTLVLLDEPEAHLHPPLLSAFIRALSDLLIDRNAVAIIATHSPVVLQEVPRSCVWILQRWGLYLGNARPYVETFGENVGILTREVFRLEVEQSGFHKFLTEAAERYNSYDQAHDSFSGQLGSEARALLQILFATR